MIISCPVPITGQYELEEGPRSIEEETKLHEKAQVDHVEKLRKYLNRPEK